MSCSILTIAPYKILPARTGGQQGIVLIHEYVSRLCPDQVVSTVDNEPDGKNSFQLHGIFPASPKRYLPYQGFDELLRIGKTYDVNHIICEHPYMALKAIRLAKKLNITWFLRSHNIESERFHTLGKAWWRILRAYEKYAMKKADGIFFVTEEDAQWVQQHFGIKASKCHFIPYGSLLERKPESSNAKEQLSKELKLDVAKPWLYFLGVLNYAPNSDAVAYILDEVMPRLDKQGQPYEVLIAGKGLDDGLQQRIAKTPHITYTGFVPDLDVFIKACDVMLNPVLKGGGIKTKAVEALGYNKRVVSCKSGAAGLKPSVCGNNLYITTDYDWDAYTESIIKAIRTPSDIPDSFYEQYYFGNIAKKIVSILPGY